MVAYLDKKFALLSRRRIQVSTHARRAAIPLSEKVIFHQRRYESMKFTFTNFKLTCHSHVEFKYMNIIMQNLDEIYIIFLGNFGFKNKFN